MSDVKIAYAAHAAMTLDLSPGGVGLASSQTVGRESSYVDNATNKYLDALVDIYFDLAAGTIAGDRGVYVYGYASIDDTNYTGGCSGTEAAYTLEALGVTTLPLIGFIPTPTANPATSKYRSVFPVARAFGGILPERWGIVVVNYSGVALETTGDTVYYQGVYQTVT